MSTTARKHDCVFEGKVPLHGGAVKSYFVADCRCGWKSPLCSTSDLAHERLDEHRAQSRRPRKTA